LNEKLQALNSSNAESSIRRRNVNWNLNDSYENDHNVADDVIVSKSSTVQNRESLRSRRNFQGSRLLNVTKEDDGFESLTRSSSGDETRLLQNHTDSDADTLRNNTPVKMCKKDLDRKRKLSSDDSNEENDEMDSLSPTSSSNHQFETTDGEYIGVTSNSESECEDDANYQSNDDDDDNVPTLKILNPNDSSEKVSVTLWTKHEAKKAEMSVLEISSSIIKRVDSIPETYDYVYIAMVLSVILSITPIYCRLCDLSNHTNSTSTIFDLPNVVDDSALTLSTLIQLAFGQTRWEKSLLLIATIQRLVLAFCFFFLLAVAERTFKQRQVVKMFLSFS
jgi:hypothetical protein